MSFDVRFISGADCHDLRSRVLRPGQPASTYVFHEDTLPESFHVGIFVDEVIVCNGTFLKQNFSEVRHSYDIKNIDEKANLILNSPNAYRLRGMATDPNHQGHGYGKELINFALNELKNRGCELLWFNARTSAQKFYEKLGATAIGDIFDIPGGGPHFVMYIKIT